MKCEADNEKSNQDRTAYVLLLRSIHSGRDNSAGNKIKMKRATKMVRGNMKIELRNS